MKFASFVSTAVATFVVSMAYVSPAQAALQARDVGNTGSTNAFYDTTLNVTWYDVNSGGMSWENAKVWASSLNVGGTTGWRLPSMSGANLNPSYSYDGSTAWGHNVLGSSSEIASLFFDTLGNKSYYDTSGNADQAGWGLTNKGGFQNLQTTIYWLNAEFAPITSSAWGFVAGEGAQSPNLKSFQLYALAVHNGDVVAQVPEPESYVMLLAGLGLIGVVSRRRTTNPIAESGLPVS